MISVHTFELTLEAGSEYFYKKRNKVKDKKSYNKDTEKEYSHIEDGITVYFPNAHSTKIKKKIKLIVNPSRLLGFDDVSNIWEPNDKNVVKMLRKLDNFIEDYFNADYELNDFKLTRIDFAANLRPGNPDKVSAYIRVLYNIRKIKGFSPKYRKTDEWYDEDLSFDLVGNSNGMEFTAYDKAAAIEQNKSEFKRKELEERLKNAMGVLRIEIRLTTQKAIRGYTDEDNTIKIIMDLSKKSQKIFFETFVDIVPYGGFYKKDQAVQIIEENISDKRMKEKMLTLLELVPRKKSLYLAIKELNDRNIDKILKNFDKLNLSPVTISKRDSFKYLKSMYTLF